MFILINKIITNLLPCRLTHLLVVLTEQYKQDFFLLLYASQQVLNRIGTRFQTAFVQRPKAFLHLGPNNIHPLFGFLGTGAPDASALDARLIFGRHFDLRGEDRLSFVERNTPVNHECPHPSRPVFPDVRNKIKIAPHTQYFLGLKTDAKYWFTEFYTMTLGSRSCNLKDNRQSKRKYRMFSVGKPPKNSLNSPRKADFRIETNGVISATYGDIRY